MQDQPTSKSDTQSMNPTECVTLALKAFQEGARKSSNGITTALQRASRERRSLLMTVRRTTDGQPMPNPFLTMIWNKTVIK